MTIDKHRLLVKKLINLTDTNSLNWEESPRVDAYQLSFPRYTLVIYAIFNEKYGENDIKIDLINQNGSTVESFTDVTLQAGADGADENWFPLMRDLYEKARRQALGADKALDEILASLK